jgi:membrane-bound lytic murein transglycosylase B
MLAAVNLVESAFGRVVHRSSAGAQGPMQFLPSTWRAYGLGGNIHSPRDAILAAANYLHQSGAPANDRHALYAYNPSRLYVDAVLTYAHEMIRDPLAYLTYYTWEASLPATLDG